MKKIIVLSDSHGNVNNMIYAVRETKPDMIIHLGDCWGDALKLKREFPKIPMECVPGNCDYVNEPNARTLRIEGFDVLICHGHLYYVKMQMTTLQTAAQAQGVDVVLFGHTHKVFYDKYNGITYLNPGSIGAPGFRVPPSYGILTLDGEAKRADVNVKYIEFT
ncbi:MAG: metallophosphoesterase [Clostridiales bacterium]|nr:metallophosphoesterase [Clostridiales bacterium]